MFFFVFQEIENFGLLDDDVFFDVLSRLPAKCLLRLKSVCKGWCRLISDRIFIKVQSQTLEPIVGFLIQQRFQWCSDDIKIITHIPVELGSAALQQSVFSFLPDDVVVLSSCNGLVCCRSCFPFSDPAIYVCNPVNKDWIKLKWTKPDKEDSVVLVFDPCQDMVDCSTNFKLVRVRQFETASEDLYFSFDIYCSSTGAWRVSQEICYCSDKLLKNKGIYVGGILHWLTDGDEILTFNVENELSWLISVPVSAAQIESDYQSCVGESDGQLYYVMISENGLQFWFLEDYFEFKWNLKYSKTLEVLEEEHPNFLCNLHERVRRRPTIDSNPWMDPLAFRDGILLIRVCAKIFLYHVETNKMNEVCYFSGLGTYSSYLPTVLPYSLSLVRLT